MSRALSDATRIKGRYQWSLNHEIGNLTKLLGHIDRALKKEEEEEEEEAIINFRPNPLFNPTLQSARLFMTLRRRANPFYLLLPTFSLKDLSTIYIPSKGYWESRTQTYNRSETSGVFLFFTLLAPSHRPKRISIIVEQSALPTSGSVCIRTWVARWSAMI